MFKNGFLKVSLAQIDSNLAKPLINAKKIVEVLDNSNAGLCVFPELCISSYSASDLFYQIYFQEECLEALNYILTTTTYKASYVLGMPLLISGVLYNCGIFIHNNKILGVIPKKYLPNHKEFYEKRWFNSYNLSNTIEIELLGKKVYFGNLLFQDTKNMITIGVEICQDLWAINSQSDIQTLSGANIICNLSASTETVNKLKVRRAIVSDHSRKQMTLYLYNNPGSFESTSEIVFSSHRIISLLGKIINEDYQYYDNSNCLTSDIYVKGISYQRSQETAYLDSMGKQKEKFKIVKFSFDETAYEFETNYPTTPFSIGVDYNYALILLVEALKRKLLSLPASNRNIIIGLSGGLDSTLAYLIAVLTIQNMNLDPSTIKAYYLPTTNSKGESYEIVKALTDYFKTSFESINIESEVNNHLKSLNHDNSGVVYENAQARIRTLVLMNKANIEKGIVLGTSDLSEIALGFSTYNGDHMSMYNILCGIPKTIVKNLVSFFKEKFNPIEYYLNRCVERPISPELLHDQDSEAIIGKYLINDFILYNYLEVGMDSNDLIFLVNKLFDGIDAKTYVNRFIDRFNNSQFKRQTSPEGPKIFSISLSPRSTYRLPSDVKIK
jgi:NAD+ synthase (glutamine-hydrolysing)